MRNTLGSGLVDYTVPTALVGIIVGLALYNMVTNNSILKFLSFSIDGDTDLKKQEININPMIKSESIKPGDLGGSSSNPVMQCKFSTCVIDYGDFILTGIPADFAEFTESAGTSGGSEVIVAIMNQLAAQLEADGDTDGAEKFQDLANITAFIAMIESQIENKAKGCIDKPDPKSCFQDEVLNNNYSGQVPESISDIITNFDYGATLLDLKYNSRVGLGRSIQNDNNALYLSDINKNPSYAFIDIFDSILNDPQIPAAMKDISVVLSQSVENLGFNHSTLSSQLYMSEVEAMETAEFDVVTGDQGTLQDFGSSTDMNILVEPQISLATQLTAALMCASGGNITSGDQCWGNLNQGGT
ncbi:MAG: hypothetical protein AB1782_04720 [Cyanobacteriota bacterium]